MRMNRREAARPQSAWRPGSGSGGLQELRRSVAVGNAPVVVVGERIERTGRGQNIDINEKGEIVGMF
jgi:hypothetical protein